jgi:chromosome partitioning protein
MKTIAVICQKGGVGKTTLVVHLAIAAELAGHTVAIIDIDQQSSAAKWGDRRAADRPAVVPATAARLEMILAAARDNGATLAIIDTAPHSSSDGLKAAQLADAILIPTRPNILDLVAMEDSVQIAQLANQATKKPTAIIFNTCPPLPQGRGVIDDAIAAVAGYKFPVVPVYVTQRAAYNHSLTNGLTAQEYEKNGKAAKEITRLYEWVSDFAGLSKRPRKEKKAA